MKIELLCKKLRVDIHKKNTRQLENLLRFFSSVKGSTFGVKKIDLTRRYYKSALSFIIKIANQRNVTQVSRNQLMRYTRISVIKPGFQTNYLLNVIIRIRQRGHGFGLPPGTNYSV